MTALAFETRAGGAPAGAPPPAGRPQRTVCILGCGVVTPSACSAQGLADLLRAGGVERRRGERRRTLPTEELNAACGLGPRVIKKVDRFSLLGVAAARAALGEAALDESGVARCGVVTGNMMAGWTFTEEQLRALHGRGVDSVSPYLATAWFPAAPQGQITINLKMRGFAKTVTTDRCAGAQAIGLAFDLIRAGRADLLLAGGVEAPVTPFVESAFEQLGGSALDLAEGAAYLLLSAGGGAGTAVGFHSTFALPASPAFPAGALAGRLAQLARALDGGGALKVAVCNVPAGAAEDEAARLLVGAFGDAGLRVAFTTRAVGECLGASGAVAAVTAHRMLSEMEPPASALVLSAGHQCCDLLWMYRTTP